MKPAAMPAPPDLLGPAVMDAAVASSLSELRDDLRGSLPKEAQTTADALIAALPDWQRAGRFSHLGERFTALSDAAGRQFNKAVVVDLNRLVVVELALCLAQALTGRAIPADILALVPAAAARLLKYLREGADETYVYPSDYLVKDLRFAAGLTLPCGAEVLDLRSTLGLRASLHLLRKKPSLKDLGALLVAGSVDPWFRTHTESRYLRYFHEAGWDAYYMRVASILEAHPGVRGVVGTSWFFDPQLATISPRLNYLRNPLLRGAFMVRGRTSAFDIASATFQSEERKRRYQGGSYVPVPYTLVWPRTELLQWAAKGLLTNNVTH